MANHGWCGICGEDFIEIARFSMGGSWRCPKDSHVIRSQNYREAIFTINGKDLSNHDPKFEELFDEYCKSHPDYDADAVEAKRKIVIESRRQYLENELEKYKEEIKSYLKDCPPYKLKADGVLGGFIIETTGDPDAFPDYKDPMWTDQRVLYKHALVFNNTVYQAKVEVLT